MTGSASYQIYRAQQLGMSRREIEKELKRLLKVSEGELKTLLTRSAEVGYRFDISQFGEEAVPFEENSVIQQIVETSVQLATDDFKNITQTLGMVDPFGNVLPLQEAYQKCMDLAYSQVATGATDYNTAIRNAVKNLSKYGIRSIDYESGVHRSLEAATRGSVMGGLGLMQEKISQQNHDDMGADGWEISAHAASAPDHEPIQGKQYSDKEYTAINNSLIRRIGTLNCGHAAYPIIMGVSEPQYTEEELEEFRRKNEEGVTFEGKHYTMYEATQTQRRLERAMRTQKRKILVDEAIKDDERLLYDQIRLRCINEEYVRFSRAADLPLQSERARVINYNRKPLHTMDQTNYMAANSVDWSKTAPIIHTTQEYDEIKKYIAEKGLNVYNIQQFDGNIDLLKEQIDIIADMKKGYGIDKRLTVSFKPMSDSDFAQFTKNGINFNTKALRNREHTNKILNADNYLAATDIKGIAVHEMGHHISNKYGEKGLELAQKAYYNIYKQTRNYKEMIPFLKEEVSVYSTNISIEHEEAPFNVKHYKEVVPEMLSKNATNPDLFSQEFVRLLKEVLS